LRYLPSQFRHQFLESVPADVDTRNSIDGVAMA